MQEILPQPLYHFWVLNFLPKMSVNFNFGNMFVSSLIIMIKSELTIYDGFFLLSITDNIANFAF